MTIQRFRHAFAEAAAALVGTKFRLRGRDPATGLDCVGLVCCALAAVGRAPPKIPFYALRNTSIRDLLALLPDAGLAETAGPVAHGDLLLLRPGPGQHHLAIARNAHQMVHAHAGLGRIAVTPIASDTDIVRRWHLT